MTWEFEPIKLLSLEFGLVFVRVIRKKIGTKLKQVYIQVSKVPGDDVTIPKGFITLKKTPHVF